MLSLVSSALYGSNIRSNFSFSCFSSNNYIPVFRNGFVFNSKSTLAFFSTKVAKKNTRKLESKTKIITTSKPKVIKPKKTNSFSKKITKPVKKKKKKISTFKRALAILSKKQLLALCKLKPHNLFGTVYDSGVVFCSIDGVVKIKNLRAARIGELLTFETGDKGIVLNLERNCVTAIVFCNDKNISQGCRVKKEGQLSSVVASRVLKGHIVNSLGEVVDGSSLNLLCETYNTLVKDNRLSSISIKPFNLKTLETFPYNAVYLNNKLQLVEAPAPSIMNRTKITEPLYTGTIIIDSMIPIGKGQRELIIGDRKIGKTTIAVDTIINQSKLLKHFGYFGDSAITSIYVAIGQRRSAILKVFSDLQFSGALNSTIIVSSTASEAASLQFLAPYVGTAYGEFFRDAGKQALIVYDDLSKHAVAYRQMSLLLRRSPGREAYPADIFYLHSRLLERSASTRIGTLTALPVVETLSGDVSSFIPTNVISITDGQIFLETDLFYKGIRPAINTGLSVSRIGSSSQNDALKKVSSRLKLDLVRYRHMEVFAMFASDLDTFTQNILNRGSRVVEVLKQKPGRPIHPLAQAILIYSGINGFLDGISLEAVDRFKEIIFKDSLYSVFPVTSFDELAYGSVDKNNLLNTYIKGCVKNI